MLFRADVVEKVVQQFEGSGDVEYLRVASTPVSRGPGILMFTMIPCERAEAIAEALVKHFAANDQGKRRHDDAEDTQGVVPSD